MFTSSINMDMKAFINKVLPKDQANKMKVRTMRWMKNVNAKLAKQVLARLKGLFDVVPQLAYSKTIAKSDKSHRDTS